MCGEGRIWAQVIAKIVGTYDILQESRKHGHALDASLDMYLLWQVWNLMPNCE